MAATYTPGSAGGARDLLRRLIPDADTTGATLNGSTYTLAAFTYSDVQLDDYLRDAANDAYGAAAAALETTIRNSVSGLGFSIDSSGTRARIADLRSRAGGSTGYSVALPREDGYTDGDS